MREKEKEGNKQNQRGGGGNISYFTWKYERTQELT